ncbi:MAG: AAA family ATPase [Myxococcales bacterium]|nr:AAA family ATPase [Myxococcales bacterium]
MDERRAAGRIILIDGASSSGKTTLARALQARLDEPFWHFSIDHLRDAGVLPLERIRSGEFRWDRLRPGFFEGFHRCLPALAHAGNDLIVEHIVESEAWMARLLALLSDVDVFFVALRCPLDELERREAERGDRRPGEARADFERDGGFALHDLALDATRTPEENAAALIDAWRGRERPSAFERMRTRSAGAWYRDGSDRRP